jgi:hypothetical protein
MAMERVLRNPKLSIVLAGIFFVIAAIYFFWPVVAGGHVDYGGAFMIFCLGIAVGVTAYVLIAGSQSE